MWGRGRAALVAVMLFAAAPVAAAVGGGRRLAECEAGTTAFTHQVISASGCDGIKGISAIDVDGDGDVDAVSASYNGDTDSWGENDGSQNFAEHVISNGEDGTYSCFMYDLDGDSDLDALTTSYKDDTVAWFENDGSQSFARRSITTSSTGAIHGIARSRRLPNLGERWTFWSTHERGELTTRPRASRNTEERETRRGPRDLRVATSLA